MDLQIPSKSTYYRYVNSYIVPVVKHHYEKVMEMTEEEVAKANKDPIDGVGISEL